MKAPRGNCYVTSEALYYLLGGKGAGWTPMHLRHEGSSHWYLMHESGLVLDVTAKQFRRPPDYRLGRGKGFLTSGPSRRAGELILRMLFSQA